VAPSAIATARENLTRRANRRRPFIIVGDRELYTVAMQEAIHAAGLSVGRFIQTICEFHPEGMELSQQVVN
jgi:hypothetical protein